MPPRQSSAVDAALREYAKAKRRTPFPNVYRIAQKHGIAPSTLYRALDKK